MDLNLSHCFITCHDVDEARTFYRDVLGLELRNDVAKGPFHWLNFAPASQEGVMIVVSNWLSPNPADADQLAALLAKGALNAVAFSTPNVDEAFEKIRASGAEVLQEPTDQAYGVRDCAFRDPSGNMIRINQA
jgi:catechol 2,3-dioxygenase-like lactoylglutathione lyase family enzyme